MKAVKIILGVLGVAVALLGVVALVLVMRFDPNQYKAELAALVKEKTGRELQVAGNLGLSLFPRLGVSAGGISLSEKEGKGTFVAVKEARLSLALMPLLSGQFVIDRVVLTGIEATLVKGRDGKTNFSDLAGGGAKEEKKADKSAPAKLQLDVAGVELGVDRLLWRDELQNKQYLLAGLALKTGRVAEDVPGKLTLSGRVEGPDALRLGLELAADYRFSLQKQQAALSGIDLKLSGDAGAMKSLRVGLGGQLEADWGKEAVQADVAVKIDDSTLKAKVNVAGFATPAIQFDADLDRIDLDRYAGGGSAGQAAAKAPADKGEKGEKGDRGGREGKGDNKGEAGKPAADKPIDLEALKGLNLKGRMRIGQLTASGLKAEKLELVLQAAGGRLDLPVMKAALYGGTLDGSASVNANSYQFTAKQRLEGINIGPLLRDVAKKDLLEGRGKVELDVQTAGRTVPSLKKALGGTAAVVFSDGAIKGINLAEALRKAKAAIGSKSAQEQQAQGGDKTDFSELTASFVIRQGVAHNEDLSAKSPFLRLGGAGDLDIGEGRMNYLAKAAVVNTSAGQGGKDLEGLAGLTVPVRISGPFESLSYRLEMGSLVSDTVKQQVRDKVQEQVKGNVQDRLKGLFGR